MQYSARGTFLGDDSGCLGGFELCAVNCVLCMQICEFACDFCYEIHNYKFYICDFHMTKCTAN